MNAIWRALIWLDKWVNDKLIRGRWETISGRCYRRIAKGCKVCYWLCKMLDKIDPDHCRKAYFNDRIRNQDLPLI